MTVRLGTWATSQVRKSDVAGWDRRAAQAESSVAKAVLDWLASLAAAVSVERFAELLQAGPQVQLAGVLQAVRLPALADVLRKPALEEAKRALRLVRNDPDLLRLTFNVVDVNVDRVVQEQVARLVREVDDSVQQAIRSVIGQAYRSGLHPYDAAPQLQRLVGLTERQSLAVMNQSRALAAQGVHPAIVDRRAEVYTERLRRYRARMIARTETIRALAGGKMAGYEAAAANGLFDPQVAQIVWVATPDACPECAELDGETASFDEGFPDGLPPLHPNCRCTFDLVMGDSTESDMSADG